MFNKSSNVFLSLGLVFCCKVFCIHNSTPAALHTQTDAEQQVKLPRRHSKTNVFLSITQTIPFHFQHSNLPALFQVRPLCTLLFGAVLSLSAPLTKPIRWSQIKQDCFQTPAGHYRTACKHLWAGQLSPRVYSTSLRGHTLEQWER